MTVRRLGDGSCAGPDGEGLVSRAELAIVRSRVIRACDALVDGEVDLAISVLEDLVCELPPTADYAAAPDVSVTEEGMLHGG